MKLMLNPFIAIESWPSCCSRQLLHGILLCIALNFRVICPVKCNSNTQSKANKLSSQGFT